MKTLTIALICATLLTTCGTTPQKATTPVLVSEKSSLNIDPQAIAPCGHLSKLDPSKKYDGKAQTEAIAQWANEHDACDNRFQAFVALVTPLLRINAPASK
jgi:hypothetical protein